MCTNFWLLSFSICQNNVWAVFFYAALIFSFLGRSSSIPEIFFFLGPACPGCNNAPPVFLLSHRQNIFRHRMFWGIKIWAIFRLGFWARLCFVTRNWVFFCSKVDWVKKVQLLYEHNFGQCLVVEIGQITALHAVIDGCESFMNQVWINFLETDCLLTIWHVGGCVVQCYQTMNFLKTKTPLFHKTW